MESLSLKNFYLQPIKTKVLSCEVLRRPDGILGGDLPKEMSVTFVRSQIPKERAFVSGQFTEQQLQQVRISGLKKFPCHVAIGEKSLDLEILIVELDEQTGVFKGELLIGSIPLVQSLIRVWSKD